MDSAQATALVALLQSYFPVPELPSSSVSTWAAALESFDYLEGQQAIHRLGRSRIARGPLQLAEVLEWCELIHAERWAQLKAETRAEVREFAQGEFGPDDDEHTQVILAEYWATVGGDTEARLRLRRAANTDPAARITLAREIALAQLEAASDPVAEGQVKPLRVSDARATRSACGAPFGTPSVIRDGVAVCPRCSSPISEGCGGYAAEQARERA